MISPLASLAAAALVGAAPLATPRSGLAALEPVGPAATAPGTGAGETAAAEAAEQPDGGQYWFALPMAFWLPETKLGLAAAGGLHFHVSEGAGDSNVFLVAGYAMEGQGTVDLSTDVALAGGTILGARLRYAYYPDNYYGIGPSTSVEDRETLTRRFAEAILTADLPLVRGLRAGPRLHGRAEEVNDVLPGGALAAGTVPGSDGFTALGLGLQATWDSRDAPLWPARGTWAQAWYVLYPLGRNDGFGRGSVEARHFLSLGRGAVLGLGALLESATPETPFSLLSKIGSTRYLRGIREGRFRDEVAWAAQAELRLPLPHRFAAALFGAVGDVGPSLWELRADTIKPAGGVGLRYRLTDQGANLRADVAVSGEAGVEFYVLLLEAF